MFGTSISESYRKVGLQSKDIDFQELRLDVANVAKDLRIRCLIIWIAQITDPDRINLVFSLILSWHACLDQRSQSLAIQLLSDQRTFSVLWATMSVVISSRCPNGIRGVEETIFQCGLKRMESRRQNVRTISSLCT